MSSPSPFIHLLTRELSLGLRRRWRILTKGGASSIALILLGLVPLLMTLLLGINLAQSRLLEQLEAQSRSPSPMVINPLVYQSLRLATQEQDTAPSKAPALALHEGLQRVMGPKAPSPDTLPDITRRYQSKGLSAFAPYGPGPLQIRPSSALKPTLAHRHQALSAWAILLILFASGLTLLNLGLGLGTLPSRRGELAWLLTHPLSEEAILGSRILTQGLLSPLAPLFTTPALTALLMTWGSPFPLALPLSLITAYALALGVAALGNLGELATQRRIEDSQIPPWRGGSILLGAGALMSIPLLLAEVGTKGDPPLLMTLSGLIPTLKLLDQGGMRALVMLTFGACLASALFGLRYGAQLLRQGALPAPTTAGAPLPGQGPNPSLGPGPSLASPVRMVGQRLLRSPGRFASACLLPLLLGAIWMGLGEAYFLQHLPGLGGASALAFAFGGAVILLGSAESFSRERSSLWLILAHPREPMAHFEPKARFWAGVGIVYGLLGLVGLLQIGWEASWGGISYVGIMLGGLWVMAHLGVALSVLFPRRDAHGMAPIGMYGFVLMGGLFVYALTRPGPFEAAAPALLATLGSVGLWSRAKDRLPWELDPAPPAMAPSPLINGLIALMIFYVGQGVLGALGQSLGPAWQLEGAIIAFAGAGLGATLWLGISLGRGELVGRMLRPPKGGSVLRGLLPGLTWGLALVGIGVGWLDTVERWPELRRSWEGLDDLGVYGEGSIWLWVMGVILAPVVEEMLFRGAILKGLMATFGPWGSIILTSLTFTALHPGVSAPPIFLLGVITGRLTLKTGWLGSAILCHALYNLAVLLARAGGVGPG